MFKKYASYFSLSFISEALIGLGSIFLAERIRNVAYYYSIFPIESPGFFFFPAWVVILAAFGVPLLLYLNRAHSFPYRVPVRRMAWPTAKAVGQLAIIIAIISFFVQGRQVSRLSLFAFALVSYPLILLKHSYFEFLLAKSEPHREILLMGKGSAALEFIGSLNREWPCGINIHGLLTDDPFLKPGDKVRGVTVLGGMGEWENILNKNEIIDEVVIFPNGRLGINLNLILSRAQELQVKVRVAVGEPDSNFNPSLQRYGWTNLISFSPNPDNCVSILVKRMVDRVGAAAALLFLSPVFVVIAALIKFGSPGPVIFFQKRAGFRGKPFKMYKFRTMYLGADDQKRLLGAANEMTGPVFKIRNDPRITGIGRILRRFSLDELPQLFNVLKGEMSLVGPRPLPLPEAGQCDRWQKRRFSVKPGITCLWQVNGRNLIDFPEWMKLDLEYVNNWSLSLDFKILIKTFTAILNGRGAY